WAVPMTGLAQVDLWGGRHYLLMSPAPLKHALAGVIIGIAAMYVVTFLSNVVAGRLFCGWGCPVGQWNRFSEQWHAPGAAGKAGAFAQRWRRAVRRGWIIGYGLALVLSIMAWWVDLRVLWRGDMRAMGLTWGVLGLGMALAAIHGRWWRWGFCMQVCPIG